ncbi:tetratricopeptide repeat protein [Psychroserpens algicola]|uniref:Tetratricopeptide repeat protein n=1 Tax=Psychroserpens algicola TaxID=1719034 RepID=A0ABT0H4K3_9FLAO|nr:tetratricopeptide repeat protein [Psychroserpens algicola]MCK8479314.1 tetratricopeptide repeat protein [Psychroserpens algicola]
MRFLFIFLVLVSFHKTLAQPSVLNQADSLYANGNFSKAITVYKTHDTPSDVYDKIAKAYVAIGNYDLAIDNYEASIKSNPQNALIKYQYAKLLSRAKKFDKAAILFNDLVYEDYKNPNYHYELGVVLEKLGDSSAMNRFRSAYDLDQTHQKAIFKVAKHFLIKRKHELSHKYIDKGLESYQNNLELISLKAQNYYYQDDFKNARTWFETLVSLGESSEFIHEKLSQIHAEFSDYKLAIEQLKLVLKYNPIDSNALFLIGTYYESLQDYAKAETYIKQALLLKDVPLDYEYQKLGVVLNRQEKYKDAIAAFNKSLKENPKNVSSEFYILMSKDKYYEDIDTKIKLYENFRDQHSDTFYAQFADRRISELKKEKFLKAED